MPYSHLDDPFYSLVPPRKDGIYRSIAYGFPDIAAAAAIFAGEKSGYAYPRIGEGNPTVRAFEKLFTKSEAKYLCGYDALATSSGMAAIFLLSCYLTSRYPARKKIVASSYLYGGTYYLFSELLPKLGIPCQLISDPHNISLWKEAFSPYTAFAFLETVSNPLTDVLDLETIAACAKDYDIPVVVDNTLPTPELFRPLHHGANMVVHSTSKEVVGDSTGLGGIIVAGGQIIKEMRNTWFVGTGPVMDPDCAKRMIKGLTTLPERSVLFASNALCLAQFLEKRPDVERVFYPFLTSSPHYRTALRQQMLGGGPVLAFELKGNIENAKRFIESLKIVIHATHLGHKKTLATHPASTTHAKIPKEIREKLRIFDTLIRISAGIEKGKKFQLVMEDIEQALVAAYKQNTQDAPVGI